MARHRSGDINERTQAKLRSGIRAGEIIDKLHAHILDGVKMTNTAVRASEILLRKVSPDMIATALSINDTAKLPLLTIVPAERRVEAVRADMPDDKLLIDSQGRGDTPASQTPHSLGDTPVKHRTVQSSSDTKSVA